MGLCPIGGPPLPVFSDPFTSVTVLDPTRGWSGVLDAPACGARAASGSYSAALLGLKGKADARSCVPANFSANASPRHEASEVAGPPTVARLFRVVLCFLGVLGRADFAMGLSGSLPGAFTRSVTQRANHVKSMSRTKHQKSARTVLRARASRSLRYRGVACGKPCTGRAGPKIGRRTLRLGKRTESRINHRGGAHWLQRVHAIADPRALRAGLDVVAEGRGPTPWQRATIALTVVVRVDVAIASLDSLGVSPHVRA